MARLRFTDDEKAVLRFLDKKFHAGDTFVDVPSLRIPNGCDDAWRNKLLDRLVAYGLIRFETNETIIIQPRFIELVFAMDNPPKPNYWKSTTEWWFSARWRCVVTVIAVILPLLVSWVQMIQTVLSWVGLLPAEK